MSFAEAGGGLADPPGGCCATPPEGADLHHLTALVLPVAAAPLPQRKPVGLGSPLSQMLAFQ